MNLSLSLGLSSIACPPQTGAAPPPAVPENTVAPALDDATPVVGQTIGASAGTWTGEPTSYTWLWHRDGVSIEETTEAYVVQSADIGHQLKRQSIATNDTGDSEPVFSDESSAILSNDTSLSVFTVDGNTVADEGAIELSNGTTNVTVVATATDAGATVGTIAGDTGLATGDNVMAFDVTAADGETVQHYNVNLHVLNLGVAEVFTVDVTGLSGPDFLTAGEGKYLVVHDSGSRVVVWFNTGTETAPDTIGGDGSAEISISPLASDTDIASAMNSALGWSAAGAVLTATASLPGARTDAEAGTSGAVITITTQGQYPS